jgi:hypothetical protein
MSCYIDQMATPNLLPDDVWAQLRPADARLTRLSYARLRLLGAAVVLAATCAALAEVSGFLMPQLTESSSTATAEPSTHVITQTIEFGNDGWFTEHIARIETAGPGLQLTGQRGDLVIGPGKHAVIEVTYRVTDCSVIRQDQPAPVLLRLRRPWGYRTVTLEGTGMPAGGVVWTACHGPD